MLSKVTGFVRVRRYKLVDSAQLAGPALEEPAPNYLTLYDTDRDDYHEQEAFKDAVKTPWTVKILGAVEAFVLRRFALHKELHPPSA